MEQNQPNPEMPIEPENGTKAASWNLPRITGIAAITVAVAMALFHFYTAGFGILEPLQQRTVHLTFALVIAFLTFPPRERASGQTSWWDVALAFAACIPTAYIWIDYDRITDRIEYVDPITIPDYAMSVLLITLVFVATRRVVGMSMVWVVIAAVAYAFLGSYIPGAFGHSGLDWTTFIDQQTMTLGGIYSIPIAVSSTYVVIFVLFGALLVKTGMGEAMIDMAKAIAGHTRGGPAKVAVHFKRPVRVDQRQFGRQRGGDGVVHHPVDEGGRLPAPFRRRGGIGGFDRRPVHAAGDGGGRLHHGRGDRHRLSDHPGRGVDSRLPLLRGPAVRRAFRGRSAGVAGARTLHPQAGRDHVAAADPVPDSDCRAAVHPDQGLFADPCRVLGDLHASAGVLCAQGDADSIGAAWSTPA